MFGFGGSKRRVAANSNWRRLEDEASTHKSLRKYKVETQKISKRTGKRPDIFGINPRNNRDRIIIDAKCVREVTSEHIKQVKGYKKNFYAKNAAIYTCSDTKVSHRKRREASDANIKIIRGQTKRRKRWYE